ncbi:uncharacterized protein LOC129310047 [Prosopis cineraria]|uniref:uncharacterized protein LOC129310047 n=1 Tax=Prosopis cineraria TaxID=364024 RepID=UPI00240FD59A|nr:uncharacterized protein LOC129310047 [Prosopis cineraria]XP_054807849.1 uncharacterized protein LOC129310047 [Prosopis cineraria]
MDCNKEEALRAKIIAEKKMESKDFTGARKIALKAQQLYPDLENIAQMLIVCDVHCSAEQKLFGNEMNWYGILQIGQSADEATIKKQYRKLALQLHPDKNKFSGAEAAFKLIGEAQRVLLDKNKRALLDMKYKVPMNRTTKQYHPAQKFHTHVNAGVQNNVRANFSNMNPQKPQQPRQSTQQGPNGSRPTFWTACPFCSSRYEFHFEAVNRSVSCHTCHRPFVAYVLGTSIAANSSRQAFSQQRDGLNHGASVGSQGMNAGNFNTKPYAERAPNFSDKSNRKRKRKKAEESSESADSLDSNDYDDDMVVDRDGVPGENYPTGREQHRRRSTRSKPQVVYKENGSDDDDDLLKPSTGAKGSGSYGAEEDNGSAADLKDEQKEVKQKDNRYSEERLHKRNEETLDRRGKEANQCSKGTGEAAEAPTIFVYPDAEFSDFEKDKKEDSFVNGQIWAVYDTVDGMPRFYALIKKVLSPGFKLRITWFEADPDDKDEIDWVENDLPVACGKYVLGNTEITEDRLMFSHLILCEKIDRSTFKVYPRKGETWALFKNWDIKWYTDVESHQNYEFDFVEILSDYVEGEGVSVAYLEKVKGFVSLFSRANKGDMDSFQIPSAELFRFSHRIPSFKMTGQERVGVPKGTFELDPASLPVNLE